MVAGAECVIARPVEDLKNTSRSRIWFRTCLVLVSMLLVVVCTCLLAAPADEGDRTDDLLASRLFVAQGRGKDWTKSAKLFSWVNSYDDGKGVTTSGQHGGTQTISACDADDPACTYHESSDSDYQKSFWTGPGVKRHSLSVKVDRDHVLPSSYENDIGEGQMATVARTSEITGKFVKRPESIPKFDIDVIDSEASIPEHRVVHDTFPRMDKEAVKYDSAVNHKFETSDGREEIAESERAIGDFSPADRIPAVVQIRRNGKVEAEKQDVAAEGDSVRSEDSIDLRELREIGVKIGNEGEEYAAANSKVRILRYEANRETEKVVKIASYLRDLTAEQAALLGRIETIRNRPDVEKEDERPDEPEISSQIQVVGSDDVSGESRTEGGDLSSDSRTAEVTSAEARVESERGAFDDKVDKTDEIAQGPATETEVQPDETQKQSEADSQEIETEEAEPSEANSQEIETDVPVYAEAEPSEANSQEIETEVSANAAEEEPSDANSQEIESEVPVNAAGEEPSEANSQETETGDHAKQTAEEIEEDTPTDDAALPESSGETDGADTEQSKTDTTVADAEIQPTETPETERPVDEDEAPSAQSDESAAPAVEEIVPPADDDNTQEETNLPSQEEAPAPEQEAPKDETATASGEADDQSEGSETPQDTETQSTDTGTPSDGTENGVEVPLAEDSAKAEFSSRHSTLRAFAAHRPSQGKAAAWTARQADSRPKGLALLRGLNGDSGARRAADRQQGTAEVLRADRRARPSTVPAQRQHALAATDRGDRKP